SINLLNVMPWVPPAIILITVCGALLLYGVCPLLAMGAVVWQIRSARVQFLFLCFTIAANILLTSAAINGYEGERIRWAVQPIYIIFAAILLESCRKWWQNARHGRIIEHTKSER